MEKKTRKGNLTERYVTRALEQIIKSPTDDYYSWGYYEALCDLAEDVLEIPIDIIARARWACNPNKGQ